MGWVSEYALLLKALHIISFTSWMAGMFYLPRLFAYHAEQPHGSSTADLFVLMEKRLQRIIMLPAMLATFFFGLLLLSQPGMLSMGWLHVKILLVLGMGGLHGYLAICRKQLASGTNTRSPRFYRLINEVPTLLFIVIVLLAVLKPF